jgi:hypothetical protein
MSGIMKMIVLQGLQSQIQNRKFKPMTKYIMVLVLFICYTYYQVTLFVADRPKSLYDILGVSRLSNFEEIKNAKNFYLE